MTMTIYLVCRLLKNWDLTLKASTHQFGRQSLVNFAQYCNILKNIFRVVKVKH